MKETDIHELNIDCQNEYMKRKDTWIVILCVTNKQMIKTNICQDTMLSFDEDIDWELEYWQTHDELDDAPHVHVPVHIDCPILLMVPNDNNKNKQNK